MAISNGGLKSILQLKMEFLYRAINLNGILVKGYVYIDRQKAARGQMRHPSLGPPPSQGTYEVSLIDETTAVRPTIITSGRFQEYYCDSVTNLTKSVPSRSVAQ